MNTGELVQEEITSENFPVKCITGIKKDHYIYYEVHWLPSWEREECLVGCEDLIELFKFQQKNEIYGPHVYKDGDNNCRDSSSAAAKSRSSLQDKQVSSSSSPHTKKKTSGSYVQKNQAEKVTEWTSEGEMKNSLSSVHNITGVFVGKDECTYYKVEWTPTWEKGENLVGCGSLIRRFFEIELGMEFPTTLLGDLHQVTMEGHEHLPFHIKQEPSSPHAQEGEDQLFSGVTDANGDSIEQLNEENKTMKSQYLELQKNFEEYGTEREATIRKLSEKLDNLRETFDTYQTQKENEVSMLAKKNEVIEEKFDNYKKEKEGEIEILLERNKEVRLKYNKQIQQSSHDMRTLQKKNSELRQKLLVAKTDREKDVRILMERNQDITDKFDTYKTESTHKIEVLTNKCDDVLLKFDQNGKEKTFEVKLLSEKVEEQREQFETYKVDKEKEIAMASKKNEDLKVKLDNLKKQKENEVELLTKRIEERRASFEKYKNQKLLEIATNVKKNEEIREKFDNYKNQKETEVSQLQKSKEEMMEWFDSRMSAKESELIAMKKKYEELTDAFDHYKRKKDYEVDILEKKDVELTKRLDHYKSEKQSEIGILSKKFDAANEQMCNYKNEKENEIHTLKKKADDLILRYELDKTDKEKDNGILLRKNENLKARFDNYKSEKDNEILVLVNKNEELRERFLRFEKEKEKEIRLLSKQVEGKFWKYDDVKKEEIDDSVWQDQNKDSKGTSSSRGKKEIEIGILLKKQNEDLKQEFEIYKGDAKAEIGRLLSKIEHMKGRFDAFKLGKEGEAGLLLKKNESLQGRYEAYKAEKESEHAGLLKKVVALHAKIRSLEKDIQNLTEENTDFKLQHEGDKKKLKRCEDEKENEISIITEQYGNLRKKYKAYKTEAVAENQALAEKVFNLKEKYKGYKKEQETDIDLLLKKIENQKEKFEKFEEKSEKEIGALTEKYEEIQEQHSNYKEENENGMETLTKKIEDLKTKHEKYKSEKELLVELLVKQKEDMTKKQASFATEKESEINLLTKKNADIRKRYENHKNNAENEIDRYTRKNQELTQRFEAYREEKDQEIKTYLKKHEELKEQLNGCKSEQEEKFKTLTKQCEDAKAVLEDYQKKRSTEIQNLYHWICQKSNQLTEAKAELSAEKMKIKFILQNVDMRGTNSIILKDFSPISKVHPGNAGRTDVIEITDDIPEFNSCEILGEYFSEDIASLKGALKDKIVRIETMKSDIKDLAASLSNVIEERQKETEVKERQVQLTKMKKEVNNNDYDPSEATTNSEDENEEEVVDHYQGTSETLGGMYVSVLKKVAACKRLNEYYKYIYSQELYTLNKALTEKDDSITSLERNVKDNEFHIQVLQDEIKQFGEDVRTGNKELMAKLLESKPVERLSPPEETFELHNLMPTVSRGPEVKEFIEPTTSSYELDDISLNSEDGESEIGDDTDSSITYKVSGTASFFTREEMYLLFNNNNNAEESDDQQSQYKPLEIYSKGNIQKSGPGNQNNTSQKNGNKSCRKRKSAEKAYHSIPYLKLHLKVNRGRHSACVSCGDKCYRGVYLKGDMKLRLGKNPFQDSECVQCFKRNNKRARRSSPDQTVDFRYEQKYDEWVNESTPERRLSSHSPSQNNKLKRDYSLNGPRCSRENTQIREQSNWSPTENNRANTQKPNRDMVNKLYKCQECPRSFNLHRTFRNHMVTHNDGECDNQHIQQHSQHPNDTDMAGNENAFKCELCGKQFNRIWNLKSHMMTHGEFIKNFGEKSEAGEKKNQDITFTCPECKKTLSLDVVLDGFLSVDSAEKDFKCHHCDFKFPSSDYEMNKGNQPEEKPTTENENEEKLTEVETEEKPYKCCLCNLQFEKPDILKEHNRRIHALSSRDYKDHFKPHKDDVDITDESATSIKSVIEYVGETRPPLNSNRIVEYDDNEEKRPAFNTDGNPERNVTYNAGRRPPFNPNRNIGYNNNMNRPFRRPPRFYNNWQANNRFNGNQSVDAGMRPNPAPMRTPYNKHHVPSNTCGDDGPRKKPLYCYTCGKQFQFFHNLKIHAKMHHAKVN